MEEGSDIAATYYADPAEVQGIPQTIRGLGRRAHTTPYPGYAAGLPCDHDRRPHFARQELPRLPSLRRDEFRHHRSYPRARRRAQTKGNLFKPVSPRDRSSARRIFRRRSDGRFGSPSFLNTISLPKRRSPSSLDRALPRNDNHDERLRAPPRLMPQSLVKRAPPGALFA